jgi:hypothetical protein
MESAIDSSFNYFRAFPLEIRELIWEAYLPHDRLVDYDQPYIIRLCTRNQLVAVGL